MSCQLTCQKDRRNWNKIANPFTQKSTANGIYHGGVGAIDGFLAVGPANNNGFLAPLNADQDQNQQQQQQNNVARRNRFVEQLPRVRADPTI